MALITGAAVGNVDTQESIVIEGAPYFYYQDYTANPLNNPDGDGYYWGLSGTTTYPAYLLGCVTDIALGEDVTMNAVRCDTEGDKSSVQKRNHLEFTLTIQHLLPLLNTYHLMKASVPTYSADVEKMGIGAINNNRYYHVYAPKVYDEDSGDLLIFHLHRCQFVDAWSLQMRSGDAWQLTGLRIRAHWDSTMPAGQEFATVIRADPGAI